MRLQRVPAEDVDKTRHRYVNRPGRDAYVFPIHDVASTDEGIRIVFGGTHVTCLPKQPVLVAEMGGQDVFAAGGAEER